MAVRVHGARGNPRAQGALPANGFIMRRFFLSAGIGLVSGVIMFFLSVAFLCIVLLVLRATTHHNPDMTLAYRAAWPVAILGAICAFIITMVRSGRSQSASQAR